MTAFLAPNLQSSAGLIFGFVLLGSQLAEVLGIVCYVCSPHKNHICDPLELWGNITTCPADVKTCYKSWSVEAWPKTMRKCGHPRDEPNDEDPCKDALQGANKMVLCRCGTDLCNAAAPTRPASAFAALALTTGLLSARVLLRTTTAT